METFKLIGVTSGKYSASSGKAKRYLKEDYPIFHYEDKNGHKYEMVVHKVNKKTLNLRCTHHRKCKARITLSIKNLDIITEDPDTGRLVLKDMPAPQIHNRQNWSEFVFHRHDRRYLLLLNISIISS